MLVGQKGNDYSVLGTAIIIGPHIALTARHVAEEYIKRYDGIERLGELGGELSFALQAVQFLDTGMRGQTWDVRKIFYNRELTDVALLYLHPVNESQRTFQWRYPKIRLLPPAVGSMVSAFGYHSSVATLREDGVLQIGTNPSHHTGPSRRFTTTDAMRSCSPSRATGPMPRFDPGMSGGPVFGDGHLCGIICSNLLPENPGVGEHTSHVATLWPAMGVLVDFDRAGHPQGISYQAIELARDKFIDAVDWERVSVITNPNGTIRVECRVPGPA